ncbi:zinc finger, CCHC-type containing protein [Tanacetum coccineum]
MVEDASSKKFLVSNFNNYKMVDSRSVMEQYHELLQILGQFTQHGLNMNESIYVSSIIDKLPPSWKDFKHTLKHSKDELSLVKLGNHFRIEETLRAEESDKGKGKEIAGSSLVNMIEDGIVVLKRTMVETLLVRDKDLRILIHHKMMHLLGGLTRMQLVMHVRIVAGLRLFIWYKMDPFFPMGDKSTKPILDRGNVVLKFSSRKTITLVNVMAVVRLPEPKRKNLSKKGIDCIFIGYAEYSKAYRFYVIEPNEYISVNSVIESRDAMFDEKRFTSIPRPKSLMPSSNEDQIDETPIETPTTHRSNRARVAKSFRYDFQLYLVKGSRDKIGTQYSYYYSIEEDPRAFDEAILLIDLAATYNLVIHVKTTFLNGDLEKEVYMKQPEGFIMPGNEHKVCKLIKSLYGLKQAPKQQHQKSDEVVLSSWFVLNQSDKCVYCKFDKSSNGVIIYLYVDDMLIFGTEQVQVDKLKEFLSSNFSMKDMGEDNVILGIRIKREDKGITITQSHYIKKILKKFKCDDCCPVSTPLDPTIKLMPNTGRVVDQLEYSRAIGCLMYEMISTRPDIAYAMGKLSRYLAFGRHLEEIHVTWAHLEKKQTRFYRPTPTSLKNFSSEAGDGVTDSK